MAEVYDINILIAAIKNIQSDLKIVKSLIANFTMDVGDIKQGQEEIRKEIHELKQRIAHWESMR